MLSALKRAFGGEMRQVRQEHAAAGAPQQARAAALVVHQEQRPQYLHVTDCSEYDLSRAPALGPCPVPWYRVQGTSADFPLTR